MFKAMSSAQVAGQGRWWDGLNGRYIKRKGDRTGW